MASQMDHCWRCEAIYPPTPPEAHDDEEPQVPNELTTTAAA